MLQEEPACNKLSKSWNEEMMAEEEVVEGEGVDFQTETLEQVFCQTFRLN